MAKRDKEEKQAKKNNKNGNNAKDNPKDSLLTSWTKRWIKATLLFLIAVIVVLSFPYFDKAGFAGELFIKICNFLIGKAYYTIPLFLFVSGLIFLKTRKKGKDLAMALALIISLVGTSGILAARDFPARNGNWIGYLFSFVLV